MRTDRIAELLRTEIASRLARELSMVGAPMVSVTRVVVAPNLAYADVFILPVDPNLPLGQALNKAKHAIPRIQRELAGEVELRRMPRLRLRIDQGQRHEDHINEILERIKREQRAESREQEPES